MGVFLLYIKLRANARFFSKTYPKNVGLPLLIRQNQKVMVYSLTACISSCASTSPLYICPFSIS